MTDSSDGAKRPRSSRQRYRSFVEDYKNRRLDEKAESVDSKPVEPEAEVSGPERKGKRRQYMREYLRWLRPHRSILGIVFLFALIMAGLEMIEPLFMRFIIDRVLLNTGLDTTGKLARLHLAGRPARPGVLPDRPRAAARVRRRPEQQPEAEVLALLPEIGRAHV